MKIKNFKRYVSQECIGYSADFKKAYFVCQVELENDAVMTAYMTATEDDFMTHLDDERPFVAVPLPK